MGTHLDPIFSLSALAVCWALWIVRLVDRFAATPNTILFGNSNPSPRPPRVHIENCKPLGRRLFADRVHIRRRGQSIFLPPNAHEFNKSIYFFIFVRSQYTTREINSTHYAIDRFNRCNIINVVTFAQIQSDFAIWWALFEHFEIDHHFQLLFSVLPQANIYHKYKKICFSEKLRQRLSRFK